MGISRKTALSISALSLVVSFGVASCSFPATAPTPPSQQSSAPSVAQSDLEAATAAKAELDTFLDDVRREASVFEATGTYKEKYKDSISHIQSDVSEEDARIIVDTFSIIYQMDPEATIETKASDFIIVGDSARIHGTKFVLTVDGNIVDTTDSEGAGTLFLYFADNQWWITKLETP